MKLVRKLTQLKIMTRYVLKRNDDIYCMDNFSGFMELWFSRGVALGGCYSCDIVIFFHYSNRKIIL